MLSEHLNDFKYLFSIFSYLLFIARRPHRTRLVGEFLLAWMVTRDFFRVLRTAYFTFRTQILAAAALSAIKLRSCGDICGRVVCTIDEHRQDRALTDPAVRFTA